MVLKNQVSVISIEDKSKHTWLPSMYSNKLYATLAQVVLVTIPNALINFKLNEKQDIIWGYIAK
jgi:hypothetical protein